MALLAQIGITPAEIFAPKIDETPRPAESPRLYALRMAEQKLLATPHQGYVLAADTAVAAGIRILPKTEHEPTARKCLTLLSGRRHRVFTAISIRTPEGKIASRAVLSAVGFARLSDAQLTAYLATDEWRGKAGAYAIQGHAAAFINFLSGSYSAVVGLPLHETANLLRGHGYRW